MTKTFFADDRTINDDWVCTEEIYIHDHNDAWSDGRLHILIFDRSN